MFWVEEADVFKQIHPHLPVLDEICRKLTSLSLFLLLLFLFFKLVNGA